MHDCLTLAIDTSCDDTAAAVVDASGQVLSNVVASQAQLHREFGGVFPTVAKKEHAAAISPTVHTALRRAQVSAKDLTAVAVTQGPGLAPALEVGIRFAYEFAQQHQLPLIPVNHVEGHLWSVFLKPKKKSGVGVDPSVHTYTNADPIVGADTWVCPNSTTLLNSSRQACPNLASPTLSLIISGGHTQFVLVSGVGEYQILGATIDDAAGECLDKIGRLLGLGYPAGPVIEQLAKNGNPFRLPFPLPMAHRPDFDMSFSGLKTHARQLVEKLQAAGQLDAQTTYDIAAAAQAGVFRAITYKLEKVLAQHPEVTELWLGGGVAANMTLRKILRTLSKSHQLTFRCPAKKSWCADNAAMIGLVAQLQLAKNPSLLTQKLEQLDRRPRWKVDERF